MIQDIFSHQHSLAGKYFHVEKSLGYNPPESLPMELNTRACQDRLRQFYAYIQEEVVEALTAKEEDVPGELSDILHFTTEFCLISGIQASRVEAVYEAHRALDIFEPPSMEHPLWTFQINLGLAMNQLKYKPWKQSPKPTDPEAFTSKVCTAYAYLLQAIRTAGCDPHTIYFDKHKENVERIQTGY